MLRHYKANADKAAVGLELLPGVKQLLETLKVCSLASMLAVAQELCLGFAEGTQTSLNLSTVCHEIQMHGAGPWRCPYMFGDRQPAANWLGKDGSSWNQAPV